jgi:hypothetical protein
MGGMQCLPPHSGRSIVPFPSLLFITGVLLLSAVTLTAGRCPSSPHTCPQQPAAVSLPHTASCRAFCILLRLLLPVSSPFSQLTPLFLRPCCPQAANDSWWEVPGFGGAWWGLTCQLVDSDDNPVSPDQQEECGEDYLGPRWEQLPNANVWWWQAEIGGSASTAAQSSPAALLL